MLLMMLDTQIRVAHVAKCTEVFLKTSMIVYIPETACIGFQFIISVPRSATIPWYPRGSAVYLHYNDAFKLQG